MLKPNTVTNEEISFRVQRIEEQLGLEWPPDDHGFGCRCLGCKREWELLHQELLRRALYDTVDELLP